MPEVAQVRAVALTHYVSLAGSLGLDGKGMLREFGIDPDVLQDPEHRLPAASVSALLAASASRSGCETFGLQLARDRHFSSLGPLSLLLRHETSFRAVLLRLIAYRRMASNIIDLELREDEEEAKILVEMRADVAHRQAVELTMANVHRFLGGAMFGGWHPAEVHFRYRAPADPAVHRQTFRAPLRFDSPFNGFVVRADTLDRPNAFHDPGFVAHALQLIESLDNRSPETSLTDGVRASLRRLLPSGAANLETVARDLAVHPRTLQRRLAQAKINFGELVSTVREDMASDLLADTDLPLGEVAFQLGYASPGSFSRWFAARMGMAPREWRRRGRSGPA